MVWRSTLKSLDYIARSPIYNHSKYWHIAANLIKSNTTSKAIAFLGPYPRGETAVVREDSVVSREFIVRYLN